MRRAPPPRTLLAALAAAADAASTSGRTGLLLPHAALAPGDRRPWRSGGALASGRAGLVSAAVTPEFGRNYTERKLLGYTPDQIFDVVADVGAYSQFVPWCVESRVLPPPSAGGEVPSSSSAPSPSPSAPVPPPPTHDTLEAELRIGFNNLSEAYTSTVALARPHTITSTVRGSAIFHHLDCAWRFAPGPLPATVWLNFGIDFAFKSAVYRHAAALFFDQVASRTVGAFEARCGELYGPPSVARRGRRVPA